MPQQTCFQLGGNFLERHKRLQNTAEISHWKTTATQCS